MNIQVALQGIRFETVQAMKGKVMETMKMILQNDPKQHCFERLTIKMVRCTWRGEGDFVVRKQQN